MVKTTLAAALAVAALALAGCGGNGGDGEEGIGESVNTSVDPNKQSREALHVKVVLRPQGDEGQSGAATLGRVRAGKTSVLIKLDGAPDNPQPAHIHAGTCDELDPRPRFPLEDVRRGRSRTQVNAALDSLLGGRFAINVHRSRKDLKSYVACGEIVASQG